MCKDAHYILARKRNQEVALFVHMQRTPNGWLLEHFFQALAN